MMICLVRVVVIVELRLDVSSVMVNSSEVSFRLSNGESSVWVCLILIILVCLLWWNMLVVMIRIVVLISSVRVSVRLLLVIVQCSVWCLLVRLCGQVWFCISEECRQRLCGMMVVLMMLIVRYRVVGLLSICGFGKNFWSILLSLGCESSNCIVKQVKISVSNVIMKVFSGCWLCLIRISISSVLVMQSKVFQVSGRLNSSFRVMVVLIILVRLQVMIVVLQVSYSRWQVFGEQCLWQVWVRFRLLVMFRCVDSVCSSIVIRLESRIIESSRQFSCVLLVMLVVQLFGFMQFIVIRQLGLVKVSRWCYQWLLLGILIVCV